jgi:gluconokinase
MTLPPAVILMGVSGSGKSTLGQALAAHCHGAFYDADDFHPPTNIQKMARGQALDDADREPWLTRLALHLAKATATESPVFLACSALKPRYRDILRSGCAEIRFVHLSGSRELIHARLSARGGHFMPLALLDSQFATLEVTPDLLHVDIDSPVQTLVAQIFLKLDPASQSAG